ncbi:hypothetical protein [Castellaniella sp. GW247-6E4]|uniref:hypothetical protein n=1 Tax=Castellaniella sp. GW247-6E4 TaxID=3140380 RepID=UPI0033156711
MAIENQQRIEIVGGASKYASDISGRYRDITFSYKKEEVGRIFNNMRTARSYDVCEYSLANFIKSYASADTGIVGVPVFPYRAFRHHIIKVRRDSILESPRDLIGKVVAIPDYSMTAGVWARGILLEEYQVHWSDIRWVSGPNQRFPVPSTVKINYTTDDLEDGVISGVYDAIISPELRDDARPDTNQRLRPLLRNADDIEREYYERTGLYPINHLIVMAESCLAKHPQAGAALYEAFSKKKVDLFGSNPSSFFGGDEMPGWLAETIARGDDPVPYGLTARNIVNIKKLTGYLREQHLISREPSVQEMFVAS